MRWRLLTHPVFTGAVALLAVNDHVLKAHWPGLVTGKLSDIAGVAMIAIALTAITNRAAPSIRVTAVAFTLLKTWPTVAVWAAPFLGGVTRTDPTDLIALLALIPLERWLSQDRQRSGAAFLLPVAVILAMSTTTATSCGAPSHTSELWSTNGLLYVSGTSGERVSTSADGGRTWTATSQNGTDSHPAPNTEACVKDTCFRAVPDVGVDQKVGSAEWVPILRYSADQRKRLHISIGEECSETTNTYPYFGSLEVSDQPDGVHLVVNMGAGLLHRGPNGSWTRPTAVFTYGNIQFPAVGPPTWTPGLGLLAPLLGGLGFLVLIVPPLRRPPRRGIPAALIAMLGGGSLFAIFVVTTLSDSRISGIWVGASSAIVFVISAAVYFTGKAVPDPAWPTPPPWPPGPPASSWPPPPRR